MASAQTDGEDYPIFVFDPRYPIDGYKFGILGRFFGLIVLHANEYFEHLHCDILAYRIYDGQTRFSTLDKVVLPDRMPRLVWKCVECAKFRFCHIWIKKEMYSMEEYVEKINMYPVLRKYASADWEEFFLDLNLHFMEKAFMLHFWRFFICHDFRPLENTFFTGLTNQMSVFVIE